MPLSTGTRLGDYEVTAPLGAGGMGEVYRAQDTRLRRAVAVKLLPEALAVDADRIARLEREARVLASLNHPHIAALYGFEEAASRHFLIMELVEGETLADRIGRGRVPVEEALRIARQIIDALEAAHEKGVVHRDLKPANIKITPDGRVKVLDFGLARLQEPETARSTPDATQSPTLSLLATQAGVILGTAAYMSPEQAKGALADQRSDLFSFGAVLYEMLTGERAFQGQSPAETMAAVLMVDPSLHTLPRGLNPRLLELLHRCLRKNPRDRWHAAADLRAELDAVITHPHAAATPAALASWRRRMIPLTAAALVGAVITGGAAWRMRPAAPAPAPIAFSVPLRDEDMPFRKLAISPDGLRIAYRDSGRLWRRDLSDPVPRAIPGTEDAGLAEPAFSPDGKSLAFVTLTDRTLKVIGIDGGAAQQLATVEVPFSVNWGPTGILFTQPGAVMRISGPGATPERIVPLAAGERAHAPQMLPDGKTVMFTVITGVAADAFDRGEIVAQSIDAGTRQTLTSGTDARYVDGGHLAFTRGGVLFAAPFDPRRLAVGEAVPVVQGIRRSANGAAHFDISATGSLAYIPGAAVLSASMMSRSELTVVEENGATKAIAVPAGLYNSPRISPDGSRVAFGSDNETEADIWIYDLNRGTAARRLTFSGKNRFPVWSPDGRAVVFQSDRDGDLGIFLQSVDTSGPVAEKLTRPAKGIAHVPESWSPKGNLAFSAADASSATLWTLSVSDKKLTQFGTARSSTPFNAEFSPDGAWLAYAVRGGAALTTIHVSAFPFSGREYEVSSRDETAHHAVWGPSGQTLFYVPGSGALAVREVVKRQGALDFGTPRTWSGKLPNVNPFGAPRNFDVFPRGDRFIYTRPTEESPSSQSGPAQLQVVVNWIAKLP